MTFKQFFSTLSSQQSPYYIVFIINVFPTIFGSRSITAENTRVEFILRVCIVKKPWPWKLAQVLRLYPHREYHEFCGKPSVFRQLWKISLFAGRNGYLNLRYLVGVFFVHQLFTNPAEIIFYFENSHVSRLSIYDIGRFWFLHFAVRPCAEVERIEYKGWLKKPEKKHTKTIKN